jgi:putative peptidoglycan lipid II flippase
MWRAANAVISGLLLAAGAITILVIIGVSGALRSKGLWLNEETRLMLELTRVMFPYMGLACLAGILMGMLNARGHFFVPAMGSAVMNLVMITTVLFIAPRVAGGLEKQIFVVAIGVVIAGFAQALYQIPTLAREGFKLRWVKPWGNPVVKQVVAKMIPGMMGVAAFQLNVVITQSMAWVTSPDIVASYDFAVRLMEFPQGIFGVSLATYMLPTLAGLAADKKFGEFRSTYAEGMGYLIFVNLLATILLVVLAEPMVRLLFQYGKFNQFATERAAWALMCLAPGLILFSLVNVTARAFYALGDTSTPMKISSVCLGLNVLFALFLIPTFREGGMGIANSLSAVFNIYLLLYALKRKLKSLELGPVRILLGRMLGAALIAAEVAWISNHYWEKFMGNANVATRAGAVFIPIALATAVYLGLLAWLKVPQVHEAIDATRNRIRR